MSPRALAPVRLALVLGLAATAGCGDDPTPTYTQQTRANLLASCQAETDVALVGDVCACTYRSLRTEVPFERFREIDRQLRDEPEAPLPDEVLEAMADCVVQVADL